MPIEMNISDKLKEALGMLIPSAEAGDIRQVLGVQPHSGVSMQTAVQLKRLDEELAGGKKGEVKPTVIPEKGLTQKEEFEKVFGVDAASKKKKQQEEELKRLMNKRK